MKPVAHLLLALCLASFSLPPTAARAADETGFKSLFNGKDFEGWRFSNQKDGDPWPENWKVKDGVIALSGGAKPHLVTIREFENFEMKFEWRALKEKYNSGFYIRSGKEAGNNQLNLAKGGEGGFIAGKVDGAKPVPLLQNKMGEWNTWRVLVQGDKVTFWCNDKPAWEATGLKPAKGHIGFQAEGAPFEFRKLELRELKP